MLCLSDNMPATIPSFREEKKKLWLRPYFPNFRLSWKLLFFFSLSISERQCYSRPGLKSWPTQSGMRATNPDTAFYTWSPRRCKAARLGMEMGLDHVTTKDEVTAAEGGAGGAFSGYLSSPLPASFQPSGELFLPPLA